LAGKHTLEWDALSEEDYESFLQSNVMPLINLVSSCANVSKSEARRLIRGGAVAIDDIRMEHEDIYVEVNGEESVLQVGKRITSRKKKIL